MEALASSELDNALFPQPPQKAEADKLSQDSSLSEKFTEKGCEIENSGIEAQQLFENWEEEISRELASDVILDEKKKLKEGDRKKSRIRRLFTGIRLKKSEESSEDDTSSDITLSSREASTTAIDDVALNNKTAFTRIIHRVQTKANRMWEQIGQKLGGRADTDEEDEIDECSKTSSLAEDVKQGGDSTDTKKEIDSQSSLEEESRVNTEE